MRILTINDSLPTAEASVLTVGNFDGVHRGHRKLLDEVVHRAPAEGLCSVAVTFDCHTRFEVGEKKGYNLLTTFGEKSRLIAMAGIDYLMKLPFDSTMSGKSAEAFIEEILITKLHMAAWVLGKGHAIGKDRGGNENFLRIMEGKYHFKTFIMDLVQVEDRTISSTQIREFIARGHVAEAVLQLGHPYLITAERTTGKKLGAKLGYPTLNFKNPYSRKVIPPAGVYAAQMEYGESVEDGALYFGECPTFHDKREVHFEFFSFSRGDQEIPVGEGANLWVHSFIRPDWVFPGADGLVKQIESDIENIKTYFKKESVQWH